MTVDIEKLEALAKAATPQNFDNAEEKAENGYIECPHCGGNGEVELEADYCNYDNSALGVQFYGIGGEFGAAEAFYRAANPAAVLELIADNKSGSSRLHELAVACATAEQERDQLKADNERISGENQRLRAGVESDMAEIDRIQAVYDAHFRKSRSYRMQLDSATEERDHLKAELAGLKTGYEAYERVNAELKAECEKLRKYGEEFASLAERRQEQVEALRKDAGRYKWLRDESESIHQFYLSTPIWFTGVKFSKENVDSTIDAAMSKEQK